MVLVLDINGTNLGRMPYRDAQDLALQQNLDLVMINKSDSVQVFKIMDHGKHKYEKKKNKQKSHSPPIKEVNFKVRIDSHDQRIKVDHIKKFLSKGSEVRITIIMKGREKANPQIARDMMDSILSSLEGLGQVIQRRTNPGTIYASVKPVDKKKKTETEGRNNARDGHDVKKPDGGVPDTEVKENSREVCTN